MLHGAVMGALVGLIVAGIAAFRLAPPTTALDRFRTLASGVGTGWWGGLFFTVALAMAARRGTPPPRLAALARAVAVAGAVTAVGAALALLAGTDVAIGTLVAVAAGAGAAHLTIAVFARQGP